MALALAIGCALAFSVTNGFLDAAHAVATLVATHAGAPGHAITLAAVGNLAGAILIGSAVAGTIAGLVTVPPARVTAVIGSGLAAAALWDVLMWAWRRPASSGHALVGGLCGAAFAAEGVTAVRWGGMNGVHPYGLAGILITLAFAAPFALALSAAVVLVNRRALRRATTRARAPVRGLQWGASAALAFSHGANDAQKSMGAVAAMLLATGHIHVFAVPEWVRISCAAAVAGGTALGARRIIPVVGRGIYRLAPLDAVAGQSTATGVILGAAWAGAPVPTSHVVASSVAGAGLGRRRPRHVHWSMVRAITFAWLVTLPGAATLGALLLLATGLA